MTVPKFATFDQLYAKPRRTRVVSIGNGSGRLTVKITALGSKEYDELLEQNQPTAAQRKKNAVYNIDTFAPALLAACLVDPKITVEQATELYNSPDWSSGEVGGLFLDCMKLCNEGLDVPFTAAD